METFSIKCYNIKKQVGKLGDFSDNYKKEAPDNVILNGLTDNSICFL
jgi:hypothetical protein